MMNQEFKNALEREQSVYGFGRSGRSLPADLPQFTGNVFFNFSTMQFAIRLSCPDAAFKGQVQISGIATREDLEKEVDKIEAFSPDQLSNYIDQFKPAPKTAEMP